MANNYCQFSEVVTTTTEAELDWWIKKIEELEAFGELEEPTEDQELLGMASGYFSIEGKDIWVHADESSDVELVVSIVQEFLKENCPDKSWSMECAFTCSKPRIGEFGGGGVLVTAETEQWFNPDTQIQTARTVWEASHETG